MMWLMKSMALAWVCVSGGYLWTVINVEHRTAYMGALEAASVEGSITSFAELILDRLKWSEDLPRRST